MSQRDDYVAWQVGEEGTAYKNDEHRCDPASPTHDCTGIASAALQVVKAQPRGFCWDSYQFSAHFRQPGARLTVAQARATKGAGLARGGVSRAADPHGHYATSLGDGRTIEAYDTADGVIIGHVDGRVWNDCGYPPGLTGFDQAPGHNPGPSNPGEARAMGMTGGTLTIHSRVQTKGAWAGKMPFIAAIQAADLTTVVVGFNGAQIVEPPHAVSFLGMSVLHLGVLHAPIEEFSVSDDGHLVGLAGDSGTFRIRTLDHYA